MAPEQASGRKEATTTLADVYSLGAILYELLTGSCPFHGDSMLETLRKLRDEELTPPSRLDPAVDRDLEAVCLTCLAKEPQERYGSSVALADDLERWLAGEPLSVRPAGLIRQVTGWLRRNVRGVVWTTVVDILGGGIGTMLISLQNVDLLVRNGQSTYQSFATLEPPAVLRYWPELPGWFFPIGFVFGCVLTLGMGPAVIALTRPRHSWNDLTLGLATGFVGGVTSFLTGLGWAVVLALSIVVSIADLRLFSQATRVTVAPKHASDVLADRYPDLKEVAPSKRGELFMGKIVSDQVTGSLTGIWIGMLLSLGVVGGGATVETLVAGYLWRRSGRFWYCVVPYLEIMLSGLFLFGCLLYFSFGISRPGKGSGPGPRL